MKNMGGIMVISGIRSIASALFITVIGLYPLSAASFDTELHHRITNTMEPSEPYILNNQVILSYQASPGTQVVSLALETEQYRIFHTYEKNRYGIFILTLPVPEGSREIRYRLIVDGLWTVDPNAELQRDQRGVQVSSITVPVNSALPTPGITLLSDGRTRFVYFGERDSRVSLIGDFNRWDPYLTPMEESPVFPGVYSVVINLPEEAHFYRYVVDGKDIPDPENHNISHNGWGETASVIQ
jgi:1,4-alpha-glucan branching enzyme